MLTTQEMDTHIEPNAVRVDRGRKMHWRVEKYCLSQRLRFGGRIYCLGCQKAFPAG